MKNKFFSVSASGTAALALCLTAMCLPQSADAQTDSAPMPAANDLAAPAAPDEPAALPSNVDPSSPLAQIIKLVQAGVSEDVIMAYVTNSTIMFNLDPDRIIYLKDIGAPDELVTAMMQRDQELQAKIAATGYQPPPQPAPATDNIAVDSTYVAPPPAPVTVNYFYDTLAPYGSWVYVNGYGRCWQPTVVTYNAGWQPYCDHGHWVSTDCGWYWMSDYSWGWAPFHYGRWFCDAHLGWCWYPGTVWAPSWVTWRYSANYCGWAPLPPYSTFVSGIGFTYHGGAVSVGFGFGLGASAYTFVPTQNFCDPHPRHYCVPPAQVTQVYDHTTVVNHFDVDNRNRTYINHGIDPGRITAVSHREIHPVDIRETSGHVARGEQLGRDGRTLYVNRPRFSNSPSPSNRGESPHAIPPRPVVGSVYQGSHSGNQNNSPLPPRNYQSTQTTTTTPIRGETPRPMPSRPAVGSAYQGSHNGNQNNNSPSPRSYRPVQTTPAPGERQYQPPVASGSPGRNEMPVPVAHFSPPGNRPAPDAPVRPPVPNDNLNNSTGNRQYPSPHMQQTEQRSPFANRGNTGGHVGAALQSPPSPARQPGVAHFAPPAQTPQRSYSAPATTPSPPVRQPAVTHFNPPAQSPAPAQTAQHNYASPRNEASPSGSQHNYSPSSAAGNQSHGSSQSSPPPVQSQTFSRARGQNGQ